MNQIKTDSAISYENWIIIWFFILLYGPYVPLFNVPVRLDHFLVPLAGLVLLFYSVKKRENPVPSYLYPFLGFILTGFISTFFSVRTGLFHVETVSFLADTEAHLRIVIIVLVFRTLVRQQNIDLKRIVKILFLAAIPLAIFGFLQIVFPRNEDILKIGPFTEWLYTGRHSRISVVAACVGVRAVSTFYHPGNFSLFCCLIVILALLSGKSIGLTQKKFFSGLMCIMIGWGSAISKGFLGGVFFLAPYLLVRKKFLPLKQLLLALVFTLLILSKVSPYSMLCYKGYLMPQSMISYYNIFFGSRFGHIELKKTVPDNNENAYESDEISDKDQTALFIFKRGNLNDSIDVFKKHPLSGSGYSTNVKSGDSMMIHILVRGGLLGSFLFIMFIFMFAKKIFDNGRKKEDSSLHESWIVAVILFSIMGILFPTFVQDRTSDVFWTLGALLAEEKSMKDAV
ncbi:MAG: hypothetical protein JW774_12550 [Candidatus Aureabacteria bacterium]|nr:hypothetical protein [Candidatus Auribacterota bacterium]